MEKIKVIELLQLIANRKKLPKKIFLPEYFRDEFRHAHLNRYGFYEYDRDGMQVRFSTDYLGLNDPIEIIEW